MEIRVSRPFTMIYPDSRQKNWSLALTSQRDCPLRQHLYSTAAFLESSLDNRLLPLLFLPFSLLTLEETSLRQYSLSKDLTIRVKSLTSPQAHTTFALGLGSWSTLLLK
jgi:hypothetical protein